MLYFSLLTCIRADIDDRHHKTNLNKDILEDLIQYNVDLQNNRTALVNNEGLNNALIKDTKTLNALSSSTYSSLHNDPMVMDDELLLSTRAINNFGEEVQKSNIEHAMKFTYGDDKVKSEMIERAVMANYV
ncbi:hypothetical protein COBT_002656 [Conglomerata obtusa]